MSDYRYPRMTEAQRRRHIARATAWGKENPEKRHEYVRRMQWRLKLKVIDLLGGACVTCSIRNPIVLSVNHIGGRRGKKITGHLLYRSILQGRVPIDDLDLRCLNCQVLHEYERGARKLPQSDEFIPIQEALADAIRR